MMLVSIIIPCYNVEKYISECIESALKQTYGNIEIICVDNNSTDNTSKLIKDYSARYPQRVIAESEKKKGAPSARNKGLKVAKGEWIQFLDADDLLLPGKIEHQMEIILSSSGIDFIAGSFIKRSVNNINRETILNDQDAFKALFVTKLGNTCANLFRSSAINEIGGWNEEMKSSQESDLMFRLLRNSKHVAFDQVPHTIIRERSDGQISQADPKINWVRYIELRCRILDYLSSEKPEYYKKERAFFEQTFFRQIRRLYRFDRVAATELYRKYLNKDFRPAAGLIYNTVFRLLGFDRTEKLFNLF
jgi:glycosyltransferase involved in cell wall biosynthesis